MPDQIELTDLQAAQVGHFLQGTCRTLEEGLASIGIETEDAIGECSMSALRLIDEQVFCCEVCGWWWELSDQAETDDSARQVCRECWEDEGGAHGHA